MIPAGTLSPPTLLRGQRSDRETVSYFSRQFLFLKEGLPTAEQSHQHPQSLTPLHIHRTTPPSELQTQICSTGRLKPSLGSQRKKGLIKLQKLLNCLDMKHLTQQQSLKNGQSSHCVWREMIFHKKKGGEKLLNLPNRPSGLRGFHGTTHEISNTLLSAGRRPHTHTPESTHIQRRD